MAAFVLAPKPAISVAKGLPIFISAICILELVLARRLVLILMLALELHGALSPGF